MSALILDGNQKSALAAVRSLGGRGIDVVVGSPKELGIAAYSTFAADQFVYPSPYEDVDGFMSALERAAQRCGDRPVIYAFSDATYFALYTHRDRLESVATLLFPSESSIKIVFDKYETFQLAKKLNIPAIETLAPMSEAECERISKDVSYPAVIKPRRSVSWHKKRGTFGTAQFVHAPEELVSEYRRLVELNGEAPLIQPRVTGGEYGVEMIAQGGEPVGLICHRRIRSMSPSGGAATVKETVTEGPLREALVLHARTLARALKWEGPIMVEFKVEHTTGTPYLMEINGRFWGSLPLALAAGVDMPHIYYRLARKEEGMTPEDTPPRYARTRHMMGDARWLMRVLFSFDRMRPYTYPSRLRAVLDFLNPGAGTRGDVWSYSDPKPFFRECIITLTRLWK